VVLQRFWLEMGNCCPLVYVENLSIKTCSRRLTHGSLLYVPKLKHNLMYVRCLCRENNYHVQFTDSSFCVKDNTINDVLLQGHN